MKEIKDFNQCHNILGLYFFFRKINLVTVKFYLYGATIFDTITIEFPSYVFIFFFDNISPAGKICPLSVYFHYLYNE